MEFTEFASYVLTNLQREKQVSREKEQNRAVKKFAPASCISMMSLFLYFRDFELLLFAVVCFTVIPEQSSTKEPLRSAVCLCDLYGSVDPNICDIVSDQRCQCKEGHTGADCSTCYQGFYRPSVEEVCQACQCSHPGSVGLGCDGSGVCHCKSGYSGKNCDVCQFGFYESGGGLCKSCQCKKLGHCLQLKDYRSDTVCQQCLKNLSWTSRCTGICDRGKDVVLQENKLVCIVAKTSAGMEATSSKDSTLQPPNKESVRNVPPATIFVTVVIFILLLLLLALFIILVRKKRQSLRHPANFPFWTVELRQEDNTSLAGVNEANNDADVMYLDDAYLMDTPENFTTAVDSIHEDDRIGYHTLR